MAQGILDCLASLDEVNAMEGLRESIERHVGSVMEEHSIQAAYRHDKKKKYE